MHKGGIFFYSLLFYPWINLRNIFDWADFLDLRVADIAISLSQDRQTASIQALKFFVREVTAIFSNFSKRSDFMLIEHYDTELTQSRVIIIIGHWMKIT